MFNGIPEIQSIHGDFYGKDFIDVEQLAPEDVFSLFELTREIEDAIQRDQLQDLQVDGTAAIIFFQPSTRTFLSFKTAAMKIGLEVIAEHGMGAFSSTIKGESLQDTIRSVIQTTMADVIVMRHPEDDSSQIAAQVSEIPIVNAGSGSKHHPSQALLDLYTIWNETSSFDNLKVSFVGDLRFGRTVKSLGTLLAMTGRDLSFNLVSPTQLMLPADIRYKWEEDGIRIQELTDIRGVLPETDVLYLTRVQREWFEKAGLESEYDAISADYIVDMQMLAESGARDDMIIMHPLPRVNELSTDLDNDPRARYFQQMRNGTLVRMALLRKIMYPEG